MDVQVLDEPLLEFGYSGTHQEQRHGLVAFGPADIEMEGRCSEVRVGVVGAAQSIEDVQAYLKACAKGVDAKNTDLVELFPEFPGCDADTGFHCRLSFGKSHSRAMSRQIMRPILDAVGDDPKIRAAVDVCATQIRLLAEKAPVDVIIVARPEGVPDGVGTESDTVGTNFHDLLKAAVIAVRVPIQIIRSSTWTGKAGVEDGATRAWNLFSAIFYKAGGKPWRLQTHRDEPSRCFVGISFTRVDKEGDLFASVAQVFNELGDGVIVRGAIAAQDEHDRQPHLSRADAQALLQDALDRYYETHGNLPARLTLHKRVRSRRPSATGSSTPRTRLDAGAS